MTDCKEYMEQISALVDGELSQRQKVELASHLQICSDCRRVYEAFSSISEAMPDELSAPPEGFSKSLMFRINAAGRAKTAKSRRSYGYLAVAACFALIVFGGLRFGIFDMFLKNSSAPTPASMADSPVDNESREQAPSINLELDLPESYEVYIGEGEDSGETGGNGVEEPIGMDLFGEQRGLLNSEFSSNEDFLESEMSRLMDAEKIALYEGEFIPGDEEYAMAVPIFEAFEEKDREALFEFMDAELLLAYDDETARELEPFCTLVFFGVKTEDGQGRESLAVTVWMLDSQLVFKIGSEPPILFLSHSFPLDFEEYVVQLTKK